MGSCGAKMNCNCPQCKGAKMAKNEMAKGTPMVLKFQLKIILRRYSGLVQLPFLEQNQISKMLIRIQF